MIGGGAENVADGVFARHEKSGIDIGSGCGVRRVEVFEDIVGVGEALSQAITGGHIPTVLLIPTVGLATLVRSSAGAVLCVDRPEMMGNDITEQNGFKHRRCRIVDARPKRFNHGVHMWVAKQNARVSLLPGAVVDAVWCGKHPTV